MSSNVKIPYETMRSVAGGMVHRLEPVCTRIAVAGSLRRLRPMVGDIELIAIPKPDINLFGEPLDSYELDSLLASWPIQMHKNGPKYKQFSFTGSTGYSYVIDLFLQPDPATWGVNYLLRTGSSEFSHRMVTPKSQGGYKPDGYEVRDARVWRNGKALETPEEECIFDLWGMEFIQPRDRN